MTYSATWTNGNAQGRLDAGSYWVELDDADELAAAINRRRSVTYQGQQDFSSDLFSGAYVREATVGSAVSPPFDSLRTNLSTDILAAPLGGQGGIPPTPTAMDWLWPVDDGDQDKVIVSGAAGVGEGQVGLFQKLNGTAGWTDPTLSAGSTAIRAVHFNELRQAVEWLRRGRWELPVYFSASIFSPLPDTPWIGGAVANNGQDELRALGFVVARTNDTPPLGLVEAQALASSAIELTADANCTVDVYHCLRPLDFVSDPPTWNHYDPSTSASWASAGGLGQGDSAFIGQLSLTADTPAQLSGASLASALQSLMDGAEQNFLVRRSDTGVQTVAITGRLLVEFDLDSPPN